MLGVEYIMCAYGGRPDSAQISIAAINNSNLIQIQMIWIETDLCSYIVRMYSMYPGIMHCSLL